MADHSVSMKASMWLPMRDLFKEGRGLYYYKLDLGR